MNEFLARLRGEAVAIIGRCTHAQRIIEMIDRQTALESGQCARDLREDQIRHMVQRFLGWRLPEDFRPDAGISFDREFNKEWCARHNVPPHRHEPTGTNLLTADQAETMVRYMIEGMP